jgi:hypothetical protein
MLWLSHSWIGRISRLGLAAATALACARGAWAAVPAAGAVDPWCGPGILTVADAWAGLTSEVSALEAIAPIPPGALAPQVPRATKIGAHLRFMRGRTALLFGDRRASMERVSDRLLSQSAALLASMTNGDSAGTTRALGDLRATLPELEAQYPREALDPLSPSALTMTGLPAPTVRVEILDLTQASTNATRVRFRLRGRNGKPIPPDALVAHQGQLIHALILDPTFTDYHHAHPTPAAGAGPGDYEFIFSPHKRTNYRIWMNLVPQPLAVEEFPYTDLATVPMSVAPDRQTNTTARTDALQVRMQWLSGEPVGGRKSRARLEFSDRDGQPVRTLEPCMGAFAHLVGFNEDFRTLVHIHPTEIPASSDSRGGPALDFEFILPRAGFTRFFLQSQVGGTLHLHPFGVDVRSP